MKIDIAERLNHHQNNKKKYLILSLVFAGLTIVSIALFIIFSNYKIQLLMSIIGSISSSLLAILAIAFYLGGYLSNKYLCVLYSQLESKEEHTIEGKYSAVNKYSTLKKGLSFLAINIDDQELYLIDDLMVNSLIDGQHYSVLLRDNFVLGISQYE